MFYKSIFKPLAFRYDAEKAHHTACWIAQQSGRSAILSAAVHRMYHYESDLLAQQFWGQTFPNPVGLAAGFDKNGRFINAMQTLGMGFVEAGSVTAQPSRGNPKPRLFRLPKDRALINRMGLNNDGAETVTQRLKNTSYAIPVGINIAKTHSPEIMGKDAVDDYLFSYQKACGVADYITVNISCPNTAEGKTFEEPESLNKLLAVLRAVIDTKAPPTLVKFSPNLDQTELKALVEICENYGIDGYVATNTSSSRQNLHTDTQTLQEMGTGGVSGAPLASKSLKTVRLIRTHIGPKKPIIGVGGIYSFETALNMLKAGANLLQVYTGLIYEGPALIKNINQKLVKHLKENNYSHLGEL
jgi:dihydroorotate dehydrogenase